MSSQEKPSASMSTRSCESSTVSSDASPHLSPDLEIEPETVKQPEAVQVRVFKWHIFQQKKIKLFILQTVENLNNLIYYFEGQL